MESLFYVILFICTHLQGPHCQVADTPLYGSANSPSVLKDWLTANNFTVLGHLKYSHIVAHFDSVLEHISPYFAPLKSHLSAYRKVLFPPAPSDDGKVAAHSNVSFEDIFTVLKGALLDEVVIEQAKQVPCDSVLGKRSRARPGELIISGNGWDAVKVSRKKNAMISPIIPHSVRLMGKGHSQGTGKGSKPARNK